MIKSRGIPEVLALAFFALNAIASPSLPVTTLCTFNGTNGANPDAALIQGADGNLYGTTRTGGQYGFGTVFQVTPSGNLTTLVSFNSTNGSHPKAPLVQGSDGNLYGTTQDGGLLDGTVFSITTNGVLNYSVSMTLTTGQGLQAGLTRGADGNFYGVAQGGGPGNAGTIFRLTPNGTVTNLFSFGAGPGAPNGLAPNGELVAGPDGNLYGATVFGSHGTLFRTDTNGNVTTLTSFSGVNGATPTGPLVLANDGNFYGLTYAGGPNDWGTVFKMDLTGTVTSIFPFNGTNGSVQYFAQDFDAVARGLAQGTDGNFYGETTCGGPGFTGSVFAGGQDTYGTGTLFQITTNGALTTLYLFGTVTNDGLYPVGGLMQANDGNYYGVTYQGGTNGVGTIFRLTISAPATQPIVIQSVSQAGGIFSLTWNTTATRSYQLQFINDLSLTNWQNLGSAILATNSLMSASDVIGPGSQRFYRVQLVP